MAELERGSAALELQLHFLRDPSAAGGDFFLSEGPRRGNSVLGDQAQQIACRVTADGRESDDSDRQYEPFRGSIARHSSRLSAGSSAAGAAALSSSLASALSSLLIPLSWCQRNS